MDDQDISTPITFAIREKIDISNDVSQLYPIVDRLIGLMSSNYEATTRNNAAYMVRRLTESSHSIPENINKDLQRILVNFDSNDLLDIKNNIIYALGFLLKKGSLIDDTTKELLVNAKRNPETYRSSKFASEYLIEGASTLENSSYIPDQELFSVLVPSEQIRPRVQRAIISQNNHFDISGFIFSSKEGLNTSQVGSSYQTSKERIPTQPKGESHLARHRPIPFEIAHLRDLAHQGELLTDIDLNFLCKVLNDVEPNEWFGMTIEHVNEVVKTLKFAGNNRQSLPDQALKVLATWLITEELKSTKTKNIIKRFFCSDDKINQFRRNAAELLSIAAKRQAKSLPQEVKCALEKLVSDQDECVQRKADDALQYLVEETDEIGDLTNIVGGIDKSAKRGATLSLAKAAIKGEELTDEILNKLGQVLEFDKDDICRRNTATALRETAKLRTLKDRSIIKSLISGVSCEDSIVRRNSVYALAHSEIHTDDLKEGFLTQLSKSLTEQETALEVTLIFKKVVDKEKKLSNPIISALVNTITNQDLDFNTKRVASEFLIDFITDKNSLSLPDILTLGNALEDRERQIRENVALLYLKSLELLYEAGYDVPPEYVNRLSVLYSVRFSLEIQLKSLNLLKMTIKSARALSDELLDSLGELLIRSRDYNLCLCVVEIFNQYAQFRYKITNKVINSLERSLTNPTLVNHSLITLKSLLFYSKKNLSERGLLALKELLFNSQEYGNIITILELVNSNYPLPSIINFLLKFEQYTQDLTIQSRTINMISVEKLVSIIKNWNEITVPERCSDRIVSTLNDVDSLLKSELTKIICSLLQHGQKLSKEASYSLIVSMKSSNELKLGVLKCLLYCVENGEILDQEHVHSLEEFLSNAENYDLQSNVLLIFKTLASRGNIISPFVLKQAIWIFNTSRDYDITRDAIAILAYSIDNLQESLKEDILIRSLNSPDEIIRKYGLSACKILNKKGRVISPRVSDMLQKEALNPSQDFDLELVEILQNFFEDNVNKEFSNNLRLKRAHALLKKDSNMSTNQEVVGLLAVVIHNGGKLSDENYMDLLYLMNSADEILRMEAVILLQDNLKRTESKLPTHVIEQLCYTLTDYKINKRTCLMLENFTNKESFNSEVIERLEKQLILVEQEEVFTSIINILELFEQTRDLPTLKMAKIALQSSSESQSNISSDLRYLKDMAFLGEHLPYFSILYLSNGLIRDREHRGETIQTILRISMNEQKIPEQLLTRLVNLVTGWDNDDASNIQKVLMRCIKTDQRLPKVVLSKIVDEIDYYKNGLIELVGELSYNHQLPTLDDGRLKHLIEDLTNLVIPKEIRKSIAIILYAVSQSNPLSQNLIENLCATFNYQLEIDIQRIVLCIIRCCYRKSMDFRSETNEIIHKLLSDLFILFDNTYSSLDLKDFSISDKIEIIDIVMSNEITIFIKLRNQPPETWRRELLCAKLLERFEGRDKSQEALFYQNLTELEKINKYASRDVKRDQILEILHEKALREILNLNQLNDILILLQVGHEKAREFVTSNLLTQHQSLKEKWILLKLGGNITDYISRSIIELLRSTDLELQFMNGLFRTEIDHPSTLVGFLTFIKENHLNQSMLLSVEYNRPITTIKEWVYLAQSLIIEPELEKVWKSPNNLLNEVRGYFIKILAKAWTFQDFIQMFQSFQEDIRIKPNQKALEYFLESLRIIDSYSLGSNAAAPNGQITVQAILMRDDPNTWSEKLHKIAMSTYFKNIGDEKCLSALMDELKSLNQHIEFLDNFIEDRLLNLYEVSLIHYRGFSEILKNKKPINQWQENDIKIWASLRKKNLANIDPLKLKLETIVIVKKAASLHSKSEINTIQFLLILLFLYYKEDNGILAEVSTGEGKTIIIAMLASILALQGKKVDVITSSPTLAQINTMQQQGFYQLLSLKVTCNCDYHFNGLDEYRDMDIIYGDTSSFQFDSLRDEQNVLKERNSTAIVDEVDCMLIDENSRIARLATSIPGMEYLEDIYVALWREVKEINQTVFRLNNVFFSCKMQGGLKGTETYQELEEIVMKGDAVKIGYNAYSFIREHIVNTFKSRIATGPENQLKESFKIMVPQFLHKFVEIQLPKWVDSALLALLEYKEDHHYAICYDDAGIERIAPVDYPNSGSVQSNIILGDGLHQFLQIKRDLKITPESIMVRFISNLTFFKQYGSKLYGLTGTLGSKVFQAYFKEIYNLQSLIIPRIRHKQFKRLSDVIANSDEDWLKEVVDDVTIETKMRRAVLVICETIGQATQVYKRLTQESASPQAISLYTRDDDNSCNVLSIEVGCGEIVIATSLAGRGADIKTKDEVELNGGLHICMIFLPASQRLVDQGFGRTSRQKNKGTGRLIINYQAIQRSFKHKDEDFKDNIVAMSIDQIIARRDKIEEEYLKSLKEQSIKIMKRDQLSKDFQIFLRGLKYDKDNQFLTKDIEGRWALWLKEMDLENHIDEKFVEFKDQISSEIEREYIFQNSFYHILKGNALVDELDNSKGLKFFKTDLQIEVKALQEYEEAITKDPIFAIGAYVGRAALYIRRGDQHNISTAKKDLMKAQEYINSIIVPQIRTMLDRPLDEIIEEKIKLGDFTSQVITRLDMFCMYSEYISQALYVIEDYQRQISICFDDGDTTTNLLKLSLKEAKDKIGSINSETLSISFNGLKAQRDIIIKDQALKTISQIDPAINNIDLRYSNVKREQINNIPLPIFDVDVSNLSAGAAIKLIERIKDADITITFGSLNKEASLNAVKNVSVRVQTIDSLEKEKKEAEQVNSEERKDIDSFVLENQTPESAIQALKSISDSPFSLNFKKLTLRRAEQVIKDAETHVVHFPNLTPKQAKEIIQSIKHREDFILTISNLSRAKAQNLLELADRTSEGLKISQLSTKEVFLHDHKSQEELLEMNSCGLSKLIVLQEHHPIPWCSITTILALSLCQLAGGAFLVVLAEEAISSLGAGLIVEGVRDLFKVFEDTRNRETNWKEYSIKKTVGLTACLALSGMIAWKSALKIVEEGNKIASQKATGKGFTDLAERAEKYLKTFLEKGWKQVTKVLAEKGVKVILNGTIERVLTSGLLSLREQILGRIKVALKEEFDKEENSTIIHRAFALDRFYQTNKWKTDIEKAGSNILLNKKSSMTEAKSLARKIIKRACDVTKNITGIDGETLKLMSNSLSTLITTAELENIIDNFVMSLSARLKEIGQDIPSIPTILKQKVQGLSTQDAITINELMINSGKIDSFGGVLQQKNEGLEKINFGVYHEYRFKVIETLKQLEKKPDHDYSSFVDPLINNLMVILTEKVMHLIEESIYPWTKFSTRLSAKAAIETCFGEEEEEEQGHEEKTVSSEEIKKKNSKKLQNVLKEPSKVMTNSKQNINLQKLLEDSKHTKFSELSSQVRREIEDERIKQLYLPSQENLTNDCQLLANTVNFDRKSSNYVEKRDSEQSVEELEEPRKEKSILGETDSSKSINIIENWFKLNQEK